MIQQIRKNIDDVKAFGPRILGRHLAGMLGRKIVTVRTPAWGPIHFRSDKTDLDTLRQVLVGRQYQLAWWSPALARLKARYEAILAEGRVPVIVDAGANIGAASLWFRAQYPLAHIVAIEPEEGNHAMLCRNLAGLPRFTPLKAAIGAEAGFVTIEADTTESWARTERAERGIPMVTVPQALAEVENGALFIVKVDIEGFEDDLFARNTDWIDDAYAVTVEPHDWMMSGKHTSRNFQRAMGARDFEIFLAGDNLIYVRV